MEVSGQKGSDVKLCNFCEDFDVRKKADGYCVECEVYICNACFVKHKVRRINRDHSLVKVKEAKSAITAVDDTFEACQHHKGKFAEIYCLNHDQVCCGECTVLNHHGCKLELVRNKAVTFTNSSDLTKLTESIAKCNHQVLKSMSLIKTNKHQLSDLYDQFVRDVNVFADEIIEQVNTMKKAIIDQAKVAMVKEESKMNEIQKETEDLIAELSRQNELLESKMDQPNKLFAISVLINPEIKKLQKQVDAMKRKNAVTRYTFKRDQLLEKTLNEKQSIGLLQKHLETEQEFEEPENTNEGTDVAESANTQPLLDRQGFCRNINVDGELLSYAAKTKGEVGLYVDNRQVGYGDCIEIEILSIGGAGSIGLGIVPEDYQNKLLPGKGKHSMGYHSDGRVYSSGYNQGNKGDKWKIGDKVRCTISSDDFWEYQFIFTHNGREVYKDYFGLNYHFAVGMNGTENKVKVII